jgi:hypothetical protein
MKAKAKKIFKVFYLLTLFLTPILSGQEKSPQRVEDPTFLIRQKSGLEIKLEDVGWQWKEEDTTGTPEKGEITFSDSKWLMYLVHWGPIQTKKITVDYVKQRMLNMWGVKFEFTGKEGEMKISGHNAAWAEAYGTNKIFYTRFIIWNCLESGREFIADTNYNLRLKTPEADFEKERLSAKTICCHEGANPETIPDLTQKFSSEHYKLSFYYPEEWFMFESPFYVPFPEYEGIRDQKMGSLLALQSDQNISVTLKWHPLEEKKEEIVMGVDQQILANLTKEIESQADVQNIQNQGFETFTVSGKKVFKTWGVYKVKNLGEKEKAFYTGDGIYEVAQWDLKEKGKKITILLKTRSYLYQGVASSPSRHFQDKFLSNLVCTIK